MKSSIILFGSAMQCAYAFSSIKQHLSIHTYSLSAGSPRLNDSLLASPSASGPELQKRRSFLATFAITSIITFLKPIPSHAFGFGINMDDKGPMRLGDESIMSPKAHGTTETAVQDNLRFGVDRRLSDKISSYTRVFAESAGYFEGTSFEEEVRQSSGPLTFYDSVSGKPLFQAPVGRDATTFIAESRVHGWPSFRDEEVNWENVRVLKNGETVSLGGTHLGHNIPDKKGNRYCIDLVSISGNPV